MIDKPGQEKNYPAPGLSLQLCLEKIAKKKKALIF
jgi:hypothetical protein